MNNELLEDDEERDEFENELEDRIFDIENPILDEWEFWHFYEHSKSSYRLADWY